LVTDRQVQRLREQRMAGKTSAAAAAAAGMSERTARVWQAGPLPSQKTGRRTWRTRIDPFEGVWAIDIGPRLIADTEGRLQALTMFEWLCSKYPDQFRPGQLRTLQGRVREWRAKHGPDQEVFFEQTAIPGREASVDFTDGGELEVTIAGEPFEHLGLSGCCRLVAGHMRSSPPVNRSRRWFPDSTARCGHSVRHRAWSVTPISRPRRTS
jgi:hypothetical protein